MQKGRRLWGYFADMVNEIVVLFRLTIVARQTGKRADRMKTLLGGRLYPLFLRLDIGEPREKFANK